LKQQVSGKVKGNMPGFHKHVGDLWWPFLTSKNLQRKIFQEMFCIMELRDVFISSLSVILTYIYLL